MELADLMNELSEDLDNIRHKYIFDPADSPTSNRMIGEIVQIINEYVLNRYLTRAFVRVRTDEDLVMELYAPGIEIGFLYYHLVVRNNVAEVKLNVNLYPEKSLN